MTAANTKLTRDEAIRWLASELLRPTDPSGDWGYSEAKATVRRSGLRVRDVEPLARDLADRCQDALDGAWVQWCGEHDIECGEGP